MAAVVALILMAAKDRGSAYLDGAHDPQMVAGQPMGFSIRRTVLTEDVRHLKTARCSHPLLWITKPVFLLYRVDL
jgi:hypothetical protein